MLQEHHSSGRLCRACQCTIQRVFECVNLSLLGVWGGGDCISLTITGAQRFLGCYKLAFPALNVVSQKQFTAKAIHIFLFLHRMDNKSWKITAGFYLGNVMNRNTSPISKLLTLLLSQQPEQHSTVQLFSATAPLDSQNCWDQQLKYPMDNGNCKEGAEAQFLRKSHHHTKETE